MRDVRRIPFPPRSSARCVQSAGQPGRLAKPEACARAGPAGCGRKKRFSFRTEGSFCGVGEEGRASASRAAWSTRPLALPCGGMSRPRGFWARGAHREGPKAVTCPPGRIARLPRLARDSHQAPAALAHRRARTADLPLRELDGAPAAPPLASVEIAFHPIPLRALATGPGERCGRVPLAKRSPLWTVALLILAALGCASGEPSSREPRPSPPPRSSAPPAGAGVAASWVQVREVWPHPAASPGDPGRGAHPPARSRPRLRRPRSRGFPRSAAARVPSRGWGGGPGRSGAACRAIRGGGAAARGPLHGLRMLPAVVPLRAGGEAGPGSAGLPAGALTARA